MVEQRICNPLVGGSSPFTSLLKTYSIIILDLRFKNHSKLNAVTFYIRPSRNRTYIGNLEGFCPNPLDDRP